MGPTCHRRLGRATDEAVPVERSGTFGSRLLVGNLVQSPCSDDQMPVVLGTHLPRLPSPPSQRSVMEARPPRKQEMVWVRFPPLAPSFALNVQRRSPGSTRRSSAPCLALSHTTTEPNQTGRKKPTGGGPFRSSFACIATEAFPPQEKERVINSALDHVPYQKTTG
jgi:hypothetical protein